MVGYLQYKGENYFLGTSNTVRMLRAICEGNLRSIEREDLIVDIRYTNSDIIPNTWKDFTDLEP